MSDSPGRASSGLRWSNWNLLLLVPLITLVTPLFNYRGPEFLGLPFFYWWQLVFVIVGVVCVGLVYVKTKDRPARSGKAEHVSVDDLDEGGK
jgi:uncharacterized protein DUF3311